jgi:hypothetical protein
MKRSLFSKFFRLGFFGLASFFWSQVLAQLFRGDIQDEVTTFGFGVVLWLVFLSWAAAKARKEGKELSW